MALDGLGLQRGELVEREWFCAGIDPVHARVGLVEASEDEVARGPPEIRDRLVAGSLDLSETARLEIEDPQPMELPPVVLRHVDSERDPVSIIGDRDSGDLRYWGELA